jgi:hypothetical protein
LPDVTDARIGQRSFELAPPEVRVASRAWEGANVYETGDSKVSQEPREFIERPVAMADRIKDEIAREG